MRLLVLARNYQDFKRWCWEKGVPELHATYVSDVERLRGVNWRTARIARTTGCTDHPQSADIEEYIRNHPSLAPTPSEVAP